MSRYYDHKSVSCEKGPKCHFLQTGVNCKGEEYECCRYFGYVLHEDKGISEEECTRYMTEEDWHKWQANFETTPKRNKKADKR